VSERPADPPASHARPGIRGPFVGAIVLGVMAAVFAVLGPAGTRAGLWSAGTGLGMFRSAVPCAVIAIVAALDDLRRHGRRLRALGVILLAAAAAALPARTWMAAHRAPPIADVTTDIDNPPRYVAVARLRVPPANSADYGGDTVARQQRASYGDLRPLIVKAAPPRVLAMAADTARAEGWTVLAQDIGFGDLGRLEATDTSFLFGRIDDIVVRIVPHPAGSRVDVRASARDDGTDDGRNARRIRRFLAFLAERAAAAPAAPAP
jgi:Protein of unknown function (DUF1499)